MAFTKILVANRAEIAARVIRTCREMKIPTVVVYSSEDRAAMHVRLSEESVPIGKTSADSGYVDIERLIAIAKETGADALHPGYGFLASDAAAARKTMAAGLTWIGPPPEVMETLRDKLKAKEIAESVGVRGLPAVVGQMDDDTLFSEAKKLGFPLMIKSPMSESGKAMRLARSTTELRRSLPWVKGDGLIHYDDDRVYLEKALAKPRHVEVQIMADCSGNVVHMWERDCSVQRRFQQVFEEAPCPLATPDFRRALCEAAVAIAKKAGYVGAGAVEFLVDSDGTFYFLEMTCHIQGGHSVTEWITGQDIVRWQIGIAQGEKLPLEQKDIPLWGHAVQARINAEDPKLGFAPSSGKITYLRTPSGHNVRNDSAVYNGWSLPLAYAPILSILSAWGPTREDAILRMATALSEYRVGGLRNNIAFHKALNEHEPFRKGQTNTRMLDNNWWSESELGPDLQFVVAAALFDELEKEEARAQQPPNRRGEADPTRWKYWDKFNRL